MILNSINDLPAYNHRLTAAPSDLLTGPIERLLTLADQILANDEKTLAAFRIDDRTAREGIILHRLNAALLRVDVDAVKAAAAELREIQTRADRRLTLGLIEEIAAEAAAAPDPQATAIGVARARLVALPYGTVEAWMKAERATQATANPDVVLGRVRAYLDPIAEKNNGLVDQETAAEIVAARVTRDRFAPVATQIASVLAYMIDEKSAKAPADVWAGREVILDAHSDARPVTVAIWDSGVDLSLFTPAPAPGLAIDGDGCPTPYLLRPTQGYEDRIAELLDVLKGLMDLRAGQMTPDALAYQQRVGRLKPEEVKEFSEALAFASSYVHGTHVAGIAVQGNPFAHVQAISMHFPHRQEDFRLDRSISERRADFYLRAVQYMQAGGTRVVNMSWRVGPAMLESMLAIQGGITDAAERRRLAAKLFAIEKSALDEAIRSAPDVLFVAGAGNEGNDANFSDYIPAGLSITNLITVGAVDRAGREAIFTSVGGTVAIYANGVEIDSLVPSGQRRAFSGTSMASPQVANAAAKLVAMKPQFTGAELRHLLLETADEVGRVKLLNARAAFERAGIQLR